MDIFFILCSASFPQILILCCTGNILDSFMEVTETPLILDFSDKHY